MKRTFFPEEFREKYRKLLGDEFEEFMRFSQMKILKSIWVNSLKINPAELKQRLEKQGAKLKQIEFHENAFEIEGIERPGSLEEFREGLFNLQEKSSMVPALVLAPRGGEKVLDMCAAPGNKTLQLSCMMEGTGEIVAIEKDFLRFKSLCFNIRKFGMVNAKAEKMDAFKLNKKDYFDKVLLDAPCSSEGLVRKDFDALKHWSQKLAGRKAKLQKKLILKGFDSLKKEGVMVYSTCSLAPEEDEEVVKHLLGKRNNAEIEKVEIKGFRMREGIEGLGCKILPQDNNSQAFYFCRLRKITD